MSTVCYCGHADCSAAPGNPGACIASARQSLEAERAEHEATRKELAKADAIIRAQREGVLLITTEDEYRALEDRAEKAERERDEARARVAQLEEVLRPLVDDVDGMGHAEEVCSRFRECDDPDGTVCTTHDDPRECPECECGASDMFRLAEAARAALSTSPSDWLAEHDRALVTRAVKHAGARWVSSPSIKDSTLVEEVLHIEKALATPLVTK